MSSLENKLSRSLQPGEYLLNIGPQHPSTHGVLRLIAVMDGETVKRVIPDIGFLHRGIEKICENRRYEQCVVFTDRLDYVSAMLNNLALAQAVEKLATIEVPPRAAWIRLIVCELQRIASHLLWLGSFCADAGAMTMFVYTMREREYILDLFESISGSRLTYGYIRVGGISREPSGEFFRKTAEFLALMQKRLPEYEDLLLENPIFLSRTKGVGFLSRQQAEAYGVTGPMLRACGLKRDLRAMGSSLPYHKLQFSIPVQDESDCFARFQVRLAEIYQSVHILQQALDLIDKSPLPKPYLKKFKVPAGAVYTAVESPRGELGVYLVSDGSAKPWRLKFRTPCFTNLAALPLMAVNCKIADLMLILGSIDIILGDIDR
jgi:NADH-quinone oxidoreductase subunit D